MPVNKLESILRSNLIHSEMASRSCQSSFDPYDLSSNNKEYWKRNNVAETTPGQSDLAAYLLTTGKLYLKAPPGVPKNWGQINQTLHDYHSNRMDISSKLWIPEIADWWRHQEETHS